MTQSILRSLSPIHCQYIRNQGLRACVSMSLVTYAVGRMLDKISAQPDQCGVSGK